MAIEYKYTCWYCGKEWVLTYLLRNPQCHVCKDKNVKREEVKKGDYYGYDENSGSPGSDDNGHDHWRD